MNNACSFPIILIYYLSLLSFTHGASNVGGVSGSLSTTIQGGTVATPKYAVVSAGISGEAVYTGQILSSTTTTISFESSSDSSETNIDPFTSGVFSSNVKSPVLTASLSGAGVGSIAITYSGTGFSVAPEIVIDYPTTGDDQATATATINGSGQISGISITSAGSGYDAPPAVRVVGGPHFVKLTESGDDDEGRVFLITDNNATRLTLDTSTLNGAETIANIFQDDFSIEVIPATTLGGTFGTTDADNPLTSGKPNTSDFVYLWSDTSQAYEPYFFLNPAWGAFPVGWYNQYKRNDGLANDMVIYPDEGFIVSRRTNSPVTLSFDGATSDSTQKLRLPAVNKQIVINNPYGGDLLLGEIIPANYIGTGASDFRPGTSQDDNTSDKLYFLVGASWDQYWYQSGYNDGITSVATATAKRGTGGSNGMTNADVSLASGTISNLESCDENGSSVDHNVSDHTLVTISGTNAPAKDFVVKIKGVFGKKLNENGDGELDINGSSVSAGNGITIFSGLIGTYKIITRVSSSKFVVRKQRDVNFDNSKGAKAWETGNVGSGYSTDTNKKAKVYFLGGGGTGAQGTFFAGDSPKIQITAPGSGYTSAPQAIISGGGWRLYGGGNGCEDNATLGATEGMIIIRRNPAGTLTYIKGANPFL